MLQESKYGGAQIIDINMDEGMLNSPRVHGEVFKSL